MTLVRRQSNYPAWSNLFNDFLSDSWGENYANANNTLPNVNIKENNDLFEVEVAAPGLAKDDFKVEVENDRLTISAETKQEEEKKDDERYTRREFSYSNFVRSFTLPDLVEGDKIEAKYDNGVLKVAIPKREEAKPKPARFIDIA